MTLEETLTDILDHPDRWVGGLLIDYGSYLTHPADSHGRMLSQEEFPGKTIIRSVQLEDDLYFSVIGEHFGCNGNLRYLTLAPAPRFPAVKDGEIVFSGENNHEWHIIPKESAS